MRKLGETQGHVLVGMRENHIRSSSPKDQWHSGCGWIWDNYSGTTRIAQSLVKRGLATVETMHHLGYPLDVYTLTDEGRKVADELIGRHKAEQAARIAEHKKHG